MKNQIFIVSTDFSAILFAENERCINEYKWNEYHWLETRNPSSGICSILSISNAIYPMWYPIPCNKSMRVDILCTRATPQNQVQNSQDVFSLNTNVSCPKASILCSNTCYTFGKKMHASGVTTQKLEKSFVAWRKMKEKLQRQQNKGKFSSDLSVCFLPALMESVSRVSHENIVFGLDPLQVLLYKFDSVQEKFVLQRQSDTDHVLFITYRKAMNSMTHYSRLELQMHRCNSGEHVPIKVLHNNVADCLNGDDEAGLTCSVNGATINGTHCKLSCSRPNCTCPDLFHQKVQGGCHPYRSKGEKQSLVFLDQRRKVPGTKLKYIYTSNFLMRENSTIQDIETNRQTQNSEVLYTDCTTAELKYYASAETTKQNCTKQHEIHCTYGCARCFSIYNLCVYEFDANKKLKYCPSGAHLTSCFNFECKEMYKCQQHYCTPFRYFLFSSSHKSNLSLFRK